MADWLNDHWFLLTLFGAYTAVLLHNAHVGRRASAGLEGYYVGSRNLGGVAVGVSFFATFASTNSYIGHAGKGYAYGVPWMTLAVLIILFTFLSWRVVGGRLRRFASEFDALTLPDFLSSRFPDAARPNLLRRVSGLVIVVSSILYLVAIFKGAGNLFERFFDIPYELAVGITLLIVVAYTSIGGFVSVVRTDVLQGTLMVVGSAMLLYFVTSAAGGLGRIGELASQPDKSHLFEWNGGIPFAVLLGISLSGSLKLLVDPRQLSRFFALRDDRQVKIGIWVAVIGMTMVLACLFPIGLYAHFLLDGVTDTDLVVPSLIANAAVIPPIAADILIVAIVAAAMSSMDSVLLVAASVTCRDVLSGVRAAGSLTMTRVAVVAFAVVSAGIALRPPGGIVEITIFSGSLYAVCFFPAILLGLHWQRGSAAAVLASMAAGVGVLLIWMLLGFNAALHEVFPGLAASLLAYVALARRAPPSAPAM